MKRLKYIRKIPTMKFIFGLALLILAIIGLAQDIKSLVLCGIAVYFLITEGFELDVDNNRYRKLKSIFGLSFGKWKTLPNIEYLSIFRTNEKTAVRSRSAETTVSNEIMHLNLFYDSNKKINAYGTYDKEDAFVKAKEIASVINVDILDATTRESKWL